MAKYRIDAVTLCSSARLPTLNLCAGVRMANGRRPSGLYVNSDTLALASSIALEGIFLLSRLFGSGMSDDDDEDCKDTSLQHHRMPWPAIFNVKITYNFFTVFSNMYISVKFWRVKLWQNKD